MDNGDLLFFLIVFFMGLHYFDTLAKKRKLKRVIKEKDEFIDRVVELVKDVKVTLEDSSTVPHFKRYTLIVESNRAILDRAAMKEEDAKRAKKDKDDDS